MGLIRTGECLVCAEPFEQEGRGRKQLYCGQTCTQTAYRNRKRALKIKLKGDTCTDCGGTYPPYVLDFDHRPGEEKLFEMGNVGSLASEKVLAEAAKCDVVCANCHRERTFQRRLESGEYIVGQGG